FPFLNVHGSIEFDGVGGVVMQWIITGVWNATLHIPHANGGAGCMPVKPDGVRVYRRGNALLNSLLSRFRQYLISCLTYFEVTGKDILQFISTGKSHFQVVGCIRFTRFQNI